MGVRVSRVLKSSPHTIRNLFCHFATVKGFSPIVRLPMKADLLPAITIDFATFCLRRYQFVRNFSLPSIRFFLRRQMADSTREIPRNRTKYPQLC